MHKQAALGYSDKQHTTLWVLVAIYIMVLTILVLFLQRAERVSATGQGPDLVISSVTLTQENPPNGIAKIEAQVKNIGNKKAAASRLLLRIEFSGGPVAEDAFIVVPALEAGTMSQVFPLEAQIGLATGGFAKADSQGEVNEKNENNNTSTPTVPAPCIGCGAVGGIAELPALAGTSLEALDSSGDNAGLVAGIVSAAVAGAITLSGAAWYVRRRSLR